MSYYITPHPHHMARRMARMAALEQPQHYRLSVDVRHDEEAYTINALTPGMKPEDLNIQIIGNLVTIEGEFKSEEQEYLLAELPHGSFRRSLELPVAVDPAKSEAVIKDGILTLRLPKADSARPKTIKVSVK